MGNYTPRLPYVLGEEWVAIREEPLKFSNLDSTFESGYTMQTYSLEPISTIRAYTDLPIASPSRVPIIGAIYPQGGESGGPIQRLVIPVSAANVTGGSGTWSPSTSASIADALNPGTGGFVSWTQGGSPASSPKPRMELFFPFGQYPILNGKRIVALNMVFLGSCSNIAGSGSPIVSPSFFVSLIRSVSPGNGTSYSSLTNWGMVNAVVDASTIPNGKMPLGDYTDMWNTAGDEQSTVMPWCMIDFLRLDPASSTRLAFEFVPNIF